MYGENSPLLLMKVLSIVNRNSIYFGQKGKFYALNGVAKAQWGYPFPNAIWEADPNPEMAIYGLKIPTTLIDEKARSLCK